MIKYKYVLFDLDGTITESAPGIRKSLEYAIKTLEKPMPDLDDYTLYIGPPLIDTFLNVCHFSEDEACKGVDLYRYYYNKTGKFDNKLYDGVRELLFKLKEQNVKTAVCTSKYEKFAKVIMDIIGITNCFGAICGSNLDKSRKDKKDLIPYAVKTLGGDFEKEKDSVVMLGDTHFDARGARLCGVDFIGVEYGYGTVNSMKSEGAATFAKTPQDIFALLQA